MTGSGGGDRQEEHSRLKEKILLDLGGRANVLVENSPNGKWRSLYGNRVVTIGYPGAPDIRGMVSFSDSGLILAISLAVEVKTGSGRLRKNQRRWRDRFISLGGLYILARRVEDVHSVIGPPGSTLSRTQICEAIHG